MWCIHEIPMGLSYLRFAGLNLDLHEHDGADGQQAHAAEASWAKSASTDVHSFLAKPDMDSH